MPAGSNGTHHCGYGNVAGKVPTNGRRSKWEPTVHLPGTPEKIAVMAQRLLDGVPIRHPLDACWEDVGGCLTNARNIPNDRSSRVD